MQHGFGLQSITAATFTTHIPLIVLATLSTPSPSQHPSPSLLNSLARVYCQALEHAVHIVLSKRLLVAGQQLHDVAHALVAVALQSQQAAWGRQLQID